MNDYQVERWDPKTKTWQAFGDPRGCVSTIDLGARQAKFSLAVRVVHGRSIAAEWKDGVRCHTGGVAVGGSWCGLSPAQRDRGRQKANAAKTLKARLRRSPAPRAAAVAREPQGVPIKKPASVPPARPVRRVMVPGLGVVEMQVVWNGT